MNLVARVGILIEELLQCRMPHHVGLIGDARRIYGLRSYYGTPLPDNNGIPGMFIGNDFEPHLQIDFDKVGNVNRMKVTNPCVSFCF